MANVAVARELAGWAWSLTDPHLRGQDPAEGLAGVGEISGSSYTAPTIDVKRLVVNLNSDEADALEEALGAPSMAEGFADLTKEVPASRKTVDWAEL